MHPVAGEDLAMNWNSWEAVEEEESKKGRPISGLHIAHNLKDVEVSKWLETWNGVERKLWEEWKRDESMGDSELGMEIEVWETEFWGVRTYVVNEVKGKDSWRNR